MGERLTIKKITGPRALAAEGLLFIAGAAAACSPTPATETQRPTVLPTESPIPTMTIAPTESPIVTPSPVITPEVTATPEATPMPIGDLVTQIIDKAKKDGWVKGTKENVTNSIIAAYANDPEAATLINPATNTLEKDVVDKILNTCATSKDSSVKVLSCAGLAGHLYWKGFMVDGNEAWFEPISDVIHFSHTELSAKDFNSFETYASNEKSPF